MSLTVGSTFAGIEGIGLGAKRAGMTLSWSCEINDDAQRVIAHHFPHLPIYGDITEIHGSYVGPVGDGYNWRLTETHKQEAVRLYGLGFSCEDLAKYFGVSRQSMWDVLHRRTSMRPRARQGTDNPFFRGGSLADDPAQNLLETAIQQGFVDRKTTCEQCGDSGFMADGRSRIQAHHPDYNKPLDVMWLCQPCHHAWHQVNRATPVGGGDANESLRRTSAKHLVPRVDVLCGGFP